MIDASVREQAALLSHCPNSRMRQVVAAFLCLAALVLIQVQCVSSQCVQRERETKRYGTLVACPIAPRPVEFYDEVIASFPAEWPLLVMLVKMDPSSMHQERLAPLLLSTAGVRDRRVLEHRSERGGDVLLFSAPESYHQLERACDLNHSYRSFLGITEYHEDDRQTKWRVRLVLDHLELMKEALKRAEYIVLIEDDALMLPEGKEFIESSIERDREERRTNGGLPLMCFQYLYYGRTVGRLYASDVLSRIVDVMENRFDEKPADWLIDTICEEIGLQIRTVGSHAVLVHLGQEHSTRVDEEGEISSPHPVRVTT